jgi:hypothetical protein
MAMLGIAENIAAAATVAINSFFILVSSLRDEFCTIADCIQSKLLSDFNLVKLKFILVKLKGLCLRAQPCTLAHRFIYADV